MQTYGLASQSFKTHKLLHIFLVANGKSKLILSFCIDFFKKESFEQKFCFDVHSSTHCEPIRTKGKKRTERDFQEHFHSHYLSSWNYCWYCISFIDFVFMFWLQVKNFGRFLYSSCNAASIKLYSSLYLFSILAEKLLYYTTIPRRGGE